MLNGLLRHLSLPVGSRADYKPGNAAGARTEAGGRCPSAVLDDKEFAMTMHRVLLCVLAAGLFNGAVQAAGLSLQPGLYETQVQSGKGKIETDRACITPEDAKDVEQYLRSQGEQNSCKLTQVQVKARHYSGQSVCQGGADLKSADVQVKSELDFSADGYKGTVRRSSPNFDGKPLNETLKISAKRVGDCPG
jgi:hypothetical protein